MADRLKKMADRLHMRLVGPSQLGLSQVDTNMVPYLSIRNGQMLILNMAYVSIRRMKPQ